MKCTLLCFCATIVLLLSGCEKTPVIEKNKIAEIVKSVKNTYAPDRRSAVWDLTVFIDNGTLILKGELNDPAAKRELFSALASVAPKIIDSVIVLPEKTLGENTFAIVTVSVANMKTEPKESAELASQALMGTVVKVWKKKGSWCFIQTPDSYLGWADAEQLELVNEKSADEWENAPKLFVAATNDRVRLQPDVKAEPVCDVVGGSLLKFVRSSGQWIRVELGDGRSGYINRTSVIDQREWGRVLKPTPEKIERTAKSLLGIPYLWGGTSTKGMDCSGFTRTVYLMNGFDLKRDADQQAEEGTEIDPGKDFENLRKGDLLFFKRMKGPSPDHISHVGIYLGNKKYIHSSGRVKISSLDPASPVFSQFNLKRFSQARRMIPLSPRAAEVLTHH